MQLICGVTSLNFNIPGLDRDPEACRYFRSSAGFRIKSGMTFDVLYHIEAYSLYSQDRACHEFFVSSIK